MLFGHNRFTCVAVAKYVKEMNFSSDNYPFMQFHCVEILLYRICTKYI